MNKTYTLTTEQLATIIINARELNDEEIFDWLEDNKSKSYNDALIELASPPNFESCDLDEIFKEVDEMYGKTKESYESDGRIAAIKVYRELSGLQLKDAITQVDKLIISEGWKIKPNFNCGNPNCSVCGNKNEFSTNKWVGKRNPDIMVRFNSKEE